MAQLVFGGSKHANAGTPKADKPDVDIQSPTHAIVIEEGSTDLIPIVGIVKGGPSPAYDHVYAVYGNKVTKKKGVAPVSSIDFLRMIDIVRAVDEGKTSTIQLDASDLPVGTYQIALLNQPANKASPIAPVVGNLGLMTSAPPRGVDYDDFDLIVKAATPTRSTPFPKEYKGLEKWKGVRAPDDVDHYYLFDQGGRMLCELGVSPPPRGSLAKGKKITVVVVIGKPRKFKAGSEIIISTIFDNPDIRQDMMGRSYVAKWDEVAGNQTRVPPPPKLKWIAIEHRLEEVGTPAHSLARFDLALDVEAEP